ncbi:MAG: LAGLIDADG family homing endonuclease, partial [Nanoarchaeota archaeon]
PPGKSVQELNLISIFAQHLPEKAAANLYVLNELFFRKVILKVGIKKLKTFVNIKYPYRWCRQTPFLDVKKLLLEKVILPKELVKAKLKVKFSTRRHDSTLAITTELAGLLGYYTAEGYCRQSKTVSQVAFIINEAQIQTALIKLIKKVFDIHPTLGENNTKITICDQLVYNLFKYVFKTGSNAYDKRVPDLIINASEKTQWSYLSAFLDGDGSVIPQNNSIVLYSVNRKLLDNFALLLAKYGIFSRYSTTMERLPGKAVKEIYLRLGKEPKKHILHHLVVRGKDAFQMKNYLTLNARLKRNKLVQLKPVNIRKVSFNKREYVLEQDHDIIIDFIKKVEKVSDKQNSYCFEVEWNTKEERNVLWGEQILNTRCDGDEACAMLLMDA